MRQKIYHFIPSAAAIQYTIPSALNRPGSRRRDEVRVIATIRPGAMLSNNITRRLSIPSRESQRDGGGPPPAKKPRLTSQSQVLSNIPSDIQAGDPPLAAVTSDLPQFGGPSNAKRTLSTSRIPLQPSATGLTPGRPRLELVINISPHKRQPGEKLWDEAAMAEEEGEPATSAPPRRNKRPGGPSLPTTNTTTQAPASKRPRGRPKGGRPGMPSLKTGQLTASAHRYIGKDVNRIPKPPAAPPSGAVAPSGQRRPGRPPRPPSPTPRDVWEALTPPRYVPFLCEWVGCKAELQNAETLRRHVRKVHGLADPLVCRWGSCGRREWQGVTAFGREGDFYEHVDKRHLLPFVWHVGDGHRNGTCLVDSSEEERVRDGGRVPGYLLGPDGKQVTPWVKEQKLEDFLTWRKNRRRLKAIILQRDANAPVEEADDGEEEETA